MFLDRVIHFGEALRDQVKGRSPKELKSLIVVPNVVHMIAHVLSFNMILSTILAFFASDPLPDLPNYPEIENSGWDHTTEKRKGSY